MIRALKI